MEYQESILLALRVRALDYAFFNVVYGAEMRDEDHATLCNESVLQSFEMFFDVDAKDQSECREALRSVKMRLGAVAAGSGDEATRLRREFQVLFVGPGSATVPLWESSYTGDPRLLFQEGTLAVRNAYRENGFLPACYPTVADDHIALELAFMAKLAQRSCQAYAEGDNSVYKTALKASADFLDNHMLLWLPLLFDRMSLNDASDFYLDVTRLAMGYASFDKSLLAELMAETHDGDRSSVG